MVRFERRVWQIGGLATLLLVVLSLRVVYWQVLRTSELQPVAYNPLALLQREPVSLQKEDPDLVKQALEFLGGGGQSGSAENMPLPVLQRTMALLEDITRGSIYDRNGRLLAYETLDEDSRRGRFYTEPSLAHAIGYVSGLRTGIAGLELAYNDSLLGLDRPLAQLQQTAHQPITGSDLYLTIDSRVQRAAGEALASRPGAIVVLDGHSGAVLAMTSAPGFDPNRMLASGYVDNLLQDCGGAASSGCRGLFINRATQALYPPGSTFKTVTLIAALDSRQVTPDTVIDFGKPVKGSNGSYYVYRVGGGVIPDPNHTESRLSIPMCYAKSANAAFARLADEMGGETFVDYAQRLGFSSPDPERFALELPASPSQLAEDLEDLSSDPLLRAATGIGQGELLASPINMGMVVLSVLNQGNLPLPYLVESIQDLSGWKHGGSTRGHSLRRVMSAQTAGEVHDMMVTVVQSGTGYRAKVKGLTVGGKTGTAQLGENAAPHAWFIGFAEDEDSGEAVVIVVLIENGGEGSQTAAPIFAKLADVALRHAGEPVEEILPLPEPVNP
jgi:peptidoglycan glycosyltransferase